MLEVRCMYCGVLTGIKNANNTKWEGVSHGICTYHYDLVIAKMRKDFEEESCEKKVSWESLSAA
jgi:hypothetical protein